MKRNNTVFLSDILKSITFIEQFTKKFTEVQFYKADMEQFAVIRNLEIIGEAARNIDDEFKRQHSGIPWRSMKALRNILIHEYFGVDLEAVWNVIQKDLPRLKKSVKACLD